MLAIKSLRRPVKHCLAAFYSRYVSISLRGIAAVGSVQPDIRGSSTGLRVIASDAMDGLQARAGITAWRAPASAAQARQAVLSLAPILHARHLSKFRPEHASLRWSSSRGLGTAVFAEGNSSAKLSPPHFLSTSSLQLVRLSVANWP